MTQDRKAIEIIHPAERADTKKQLLLFLLVTYGVTYASGLLIWYGSAAGMVTIPVDMTVSNGMSILLANEYAARILLNPELTWIVLPSSLIVNGLLFGSFLFAKEFRKIR